MSLELVFAVAALVQSVCIVGGGFYFTGRWTAILEALKSLSADHEDRIRALEQRP